MALAPGRYWLIRFPSSTGDIIAKFDTDGETAIPDSIADYSDFVVQEISDKSTLKNKTVDQSSLTQAEKDLLDSAYPAR